MLTTFTLLTAAGVGFRLALAWGLRKRYNLRLTIPEVLAVVLLVLAGLPDWLRPIPFPFPTQVLPFSLLPLIHYLYLLMGRDNL